MSVFYLVGRKAMIVYMDMPYFLSESTWSSLLLLTNSKIRREWNDKVKKQMVTLP